MIALLVACAVCLGAANAMAEGKGQEELDEATALKVTAQNARDLERVVKLCETAITKGLDEENEKFARQLVSSTLYENAALICSQIFDAEKPHPRWPLLREVAIPLLKKALNFNPDMLDAHLLLAKLQALPGGEQDGGSQAADAAVKLAKDDKEKLSEALVLRARLSDDKDKQMADLNQAIKIDPANKDALRIRGLLYLAEEEHQKAIDDFENLIKIDGEDVTAYHAIAEAFTHLEKYKEAREYANKAIELRPEHALGYTLRARLFVMEEKIKEAIKDLNKAVEVAPRDISSRILRARLYFEEEDYKKALQDVDRVLLLQPRLEQALLMRAMIYGSEDKYDDALRDLQKLTEANPANSGYKLQMAAYLAASERPRAAIKMYGEVIDEDPENVFALRGRADALLSVSKHEEAIEDYEAILEIEPEHSGALNNLAWVLATSHKKKVRNGKRAIEVATKACEVTEFKMPHILSTLAAGYAESGDFETARTWSTKAVELAEKDVAEQLQEELESYKKEKPWREEQNVKERPALGEPRGGSFEL